MIQAVAVQFGRKLSEKDVLRMNIADRSRYLHQNPIIGVQMFQHRIEAFFSEYLPCGAHPLGHITDYVIKIVPDERITSCPLLAVGKRCPKS